MKNVGRLCDTLLAPVELQNALTGIGQLCHCQTKHVLFRANDANAGVFLVCKGKVCLQVPGAPQLDRVFGTGSLLGLPATFNRTSYSLTATCIADSEIIHVDSDRFLTLMAAQSEFCGEATKLLCLEVKFIFSAYRTHGSSRPKKRHPHWSRPKEPRAIQ